ncbi:MAG: hypothetical protein ACFFCW_36960, partial [Candidatus Hodarchaeota archaeon]
VSFSLFIRSLAPKIMLIFYIWSVKFKSLRGLHHEGNSLGNGVMAEKLRVIIYNIVFEVV